MLILFLAHYLLIESTELIIEQGTESNNEYLKCNIAEKRLILLKLT